MNDKMTVEFDIYELELAISVLVKEIRNGASPVRMRKCIDLYEKLGELSEEYWEKQE